MADYFYSLEELLTEAYMHSNIGEQFRAVDMMLGIREEENQ